MSFPRFSIGSLIAFIGVVGVGLAALVQLNMFWAIVIPTLAAVLLLAAVLGASLKRGRKRAFWLGFAVFGISFVLYITTLWIAFPNRSEVLGSNSDWIMYPFDFYVELWTLPSALAHQEFNWSNFRDVATQLGESDEKTQIPVIVAMQQMAFAFLGGLIGRRMAPKDDGQPGQDATTR